MNNYGEIIMKLFLNILMVATLIFGLMPIPLASAQGSYDKNKKEIELTAAIINLERKDIIAQNMKLSGDEERRFWSLYNDYRLTMNEVGKRKTKLITDYADRVNTGSLSDAEALRLLKEFIAIERSKLTRKEEYISKFQEVLPPKKVALFFQIENKIDAVLNFDLAKAIPLVK
jgi:hypothetical protein